MTENSGYYADVVEDRELLRRVLQHSHHDENAVDQILDGKFEAVSFETPLTTISDVIRQHEVEHIDLLKVDVERCEVNVLAGIEPDDWKKIDQIVVEVHDVDGRLAFLRAFLADRGFHSSVLEQPRLTGTGLFQLYAFRSACSDGERRSDRLIQAAQVISDSQRYLFPEQMRDHLKKLLPEYMVPAAYVMLGQLPMTANGKVDRRALPAPEDHLELGQYVAPDTPTQELLASIWSQVLKIERVGIHDNFFELGGDSIRSMKIVARASRKGIRITVRQMFDHPSIFELSSIAGVMNDFDHEQGLVQGQIPLTPIQHWFFQSNSEEPHHFNHSFLLKPRRPLSPAFVERVIEHLVLHHDVLRARFERSNDEWKQINTRIGKFAFAYIDLSDPMMDARENEMVNRADRLQAELNIESGPLLSAALIDLGAVLGQRLLLIVHHLVVDGVSWQILWEDFAELYDQVEHGAPARLPSKTTSFKTWSERLHWYAASPEIRAEVAYWCRQLDRDLIVPLPRDFAGDNRVSSGKTIAVALSVENTRALLTQVPEVYRTQINDALLTALVLAFAHWTGQRRLLIDMEAHGREELFHDVDVSRTVGWFTTLFPVVLDLSRVSDEGEEIRTIKAQVRAIPKGGIGYGLLRYLVHNEVVPQSEAEVSFNYLGHVEMDGSSRLFHFASEDTGSVQSPRGQRTYLIGVNSLIVDGCLYSHWSYSSAIHRQQTIELLAAEFIKILEKLIAHCKDAEGTFSSEDFPLLQVH